MILLASYGLTCMSFDSVELLYSPIIQFSVIIDLRIPHTNFAELLLPSYTNDSMAGLLILIFWDSFSLAYHIIVVIKIILDCGSLPLFIVHDHDHTAYCILCHVQHSYQYLICRKSMHGMHSSIS